MTASLDPMKAVGLTGLALAQAIAPAAQAGVFRYHDEHVLGTRMKLVVVAEAETDADRAAVAVRAEIDRLDGIFNSRRLGSELVALNQASRMSVSSELFEVIERAELLREATGGAFDGRLGEPLRLWRTAIEAPPAEAALSKAVLAASKGVTLEPETRTVVRAPGAVFALDGVAKGYIVDKALEAARAASPAVRGLLVDMGGDVRCFGRAPEGTSWPIGVSDPLRPGDNADCVAIAHLNDAAIATSGRGPRDRIIGGERFSPTLDPRTGEAVAGNAGASVVARCAAEADALASAFLVMPANEAAALADEMPGVAARITTAAGEVHASRGWRALATEAPARLIRTQSPGARVSRIPVEQKWGRDWELEMVYVAPDRQEQSRRNPDFRSPYAVIWISDASFRPVRTVVMVGKELDWHRDNFIWFNAYKQSAKRIVETRSESTALSGRYSLYWTGIDDAWEPLPIGDYVLHLETSQERGKHTYRSVKLKIGREPFATVLPSTAEGGGLRVSFGPTKR